MPPRSHTITAIASDHDLLIRIDTKVDVLQGTMQETRTALSARIDRLAQEKASYADLDPLRKQIEAAQAIAQTAVATKTDKTDFNALIDKVDATRRLVWIGVGILVALQCLAPFMWARLFHG
jgi:hypothetical protein